MLKLQVTISSQIHQLYEGLKYDWRSFRSWKPGVSRNILSEPIFVLLIVWFSIVFLYAHNVTELQAGALLFPLGALTIAACILLMVGRLIWRTWVKAGLAVGLFVFLNSSYGALASIYPSFSRSQWWRADFTLLPAMLVLLIGGWVWIKRTNRSLTNIIKPLNLIFGLLLLMPAGQALWTGFNRSFMADGQSVALAAKTGSSDTQSKLGYKPDVYYIILDRYANQDTLLNDYGFDNSNFLNSLKKQGFYVANKSASNYPFTPISLSSSLNMDYHQSIPDTKIPYPDLSTNIYRQLQNTRVDQVFHSLGYQVYQMGSWFDATHTDRGADQNFVYQPLYDDLDSFSNQLLSGMMVTPIIHAAIPGAFAQNVYEMHRNNFEFQVQTFPQVAAKSGPKFVFLHMLMPHPPYVYDANCQELSDPEDQGAKDEMPYYIAQTQCANTTAENLIHAILTSSSQKPIIILQSDEGPYAMKYPMPHNDNAAFKKASSDQVLERSRILNAYYLPDGDTSQLYQTITPVNSFRTIFRQYFGLDYPNLPDNTFGFESTKKVQTYIDETSVIKQWQNGE